MVGEGRIWWQLNYQGSSPVRSIKRVFSTDDGYFTLILRVNLAFVALLMVLAFLLPLSSSAKWTLLLLEAFVGGLNWALLAYVRKR